MNIAHYISNWWKEALEYKERVLKDGGITKREDVVQQYNQMCKQNGIFDSIKFAWLGEAGGKFRDSGANRFWTKAYSLATPQAKYGPELVVNGGFDSGLLTPFSAIGNHSAIYSNGVASITTTGAYSAGSNEFRSGTLSLTSGVLYKVKLDLRSISGNTSFSGRLDSNTGILNVVLTSNWQTFTLYTTATATSTSILWRCGIAGAGVFEFDNLSVVEVINSLDGSPTDATQTTSTSQPYITGNIAPTERLGMKNPNGGSNYMTHPTISFAANEAWSVTTVLNSNSTNGAHQYYCGNTTDISWLAIRQGGRLGFKNASGASISGSNYSFLPFFGKSKSITYVANGLGNLKIYVDGLLAENFTIQTNCQFSSFVFAGVPGLPLYGSIHAHIIRSQALTPTQVAAEANFLRSLYPEIPSVTIGSQTWATSNCDMVATPQGNLIQNVTANSNVEKITNGGFDTDTNWNKSNATISGGVATINGASAYSNINQSIGTTFLNKWLKITYTVVSNTLNISTLNIGGDISTRIVSSNTPIDGTVGTHTTYLQATGNGGGVFIQLTPSSTSGNIVLDNVSVQEVGWSDATNLYDYVYANTSGTVEQKTYAAVKAAAMWCYYNNDAALGSIYGKIYDWYSTYLLQKDIWYYCMTGSNVVANPYLSGNVYYVRINARTSGAGTVSINATGQGSSNVITLSGSDKLYELYIKGTDGVMPNLTYSGTGSMTVTEFTMYNDIWGWRVPTDIDFNTLATYLGGASVAGGKMKKDGLVYWASPNTGADNSSGFSLLASGRRTEDGSFGSISTSGQCWTSVSVDATTAYIRYSSNSDAVLQINNLSKMRGAPMRLIKN